MNDMSQVHMHTVKEVEKLVIYALSKTSGMFSTVNIVPTTLLDFKES